MEKDVSLGGQNILVIKSAQGVASVSVGLVAPNIPGAPELDVVFKIGDKALVDALVLWLETKSPSGIVPFEEALRGMIDSELSAAA